MTYDLPALTERCLSKIKEGTQLFVGIAGPPGSGKSTLAEHLCSEINRRSGEGCAVVLPMDGFHYSRAKLREMSSSGLVIGDPESTSGASTSYDDLLSRRGAPWTFDGPGLVQTFRQAKADGELTFPTYSRQLSDPVPDGTRLQKTHKIVLCEGNYLLAFDDAEFAPLEDVWDDKWYISTAEETLLDRLVKRHLETWSDEKTRMWGEGEAGAAAKAKANDLKNARWIEDNSLSHADIVIKT